MLQDLTAAVLIFVMRKSTEPPWALHFDGHREQQDHKSHQVYRDRSSQPRNEVDAISGLQHELHSNAAQRNNSEFDDEVSGSDFAGFNEINHARRQIQTSSVASGEWKRPASMAPRWAAGGVQELLVGSPTRGRKVF
jgi:hypothetical protein